MLGGGPEALLELVDLQRRTIACEFVQQQTIANKQRLEERDPVKRRHNLDELRATAADPQRARQFLRGTAMLASQRRAAALTVADLSPRARRPARSSGRAPMKLAVPNLISPSYLPAIAAVELGFFRAEGLTSNWS